VCKDCRERWLISLLDRAANLLENARDDEVEGQGAGCTMLLATILEFQCAQSTVNMTACLT
jgi:hypothetical protein